MVVVEHLTKRYGAKAAVDDVSFEVSQGEILGFLGPNGAGKTTTLRVLAGFLGMTQGRVVVCGHDIEHDALEAKKSLGYMPESAPLYLEMRVREYLSFRAELKRVSRKDRVAFVGEAMEKSGVTDVAEMPIGKLSKGYRQRVGLADALVAKPKLLILDEPTAGLDPNQIREVRRVIQELGKEHTVIVSTHILSEVEATATRVLVLAKGKIVTQGTVDEVKRARTRQAVEITVRGKAAHAIEVLTPITGIAKVKRIDERDGIATLRCRWQKSFADAPAATEACVAALVSAGLGVREVRGASGSLEEVFAELTAEAPGKGESEDEP